MKNVEDMTDPKEIRQRINEIDRHRGNLWGLLEKHETGERKITPQECLRDPQLAKALEAHEHLRKIEKEIADGYRCVDGSVDHHV